MVSTKRILNVAINLLFGVMLVACGSKAEEKSISTAISTTSSATAIVPTELSSPNVQVEISLFSFHDKQITIPAGTKVTWVNHDNIEHSITSGTPENPDGAFDSGLFVKDETFSMVFDTPGEFHYFCRRHNHMQGVVIVTAP